MTKLSGDSLKNALWDTLNKVKTKKINPDIANAVAANSREIMRVVKTEMTLAMLKKRTPSQKLIG